MADIPVHALSEKGFAEAVQKASEERFTQTYGFHPKVAEVCRNIVRRDLTGGKE